MTKEEAFSEAKEGAIQLASAFTERLYTAGIAVECQPSYQQDDEGNFEPCLRLIVKNKALSNWLEEEHGDEIREAVGFGSFGTIEIVACE